MICWLCIHSILLHRFLFYSVCSASGSHRTNEKNARDIAKSVSEKASAADTSDIVPPYHLSYQKKAFDVIDARNLLASDTEKRALGRALSGECMMNARREALSSLLLYYDIIGKWTFSGKLGIRSLIFKMNMVSWRSEVEEQKYFILMFCLLIRFCLEIFFA